MQQKSLSKRQQDDSKILIKEETGRINAAKILIKQATIQINAAKSLIKEATG